MSRAAKYAIPAVCSAFLLAFAALFVLRALLAADPPPSAVGRWAGESPVGTRLELAEGGRLGPSVIPAFVCRWDHASPLPDDQLAVTDGTWSEGHDADAGYLVTVRFERPRRCALTFSTEVKKGKGHTLWTGVIQEQWTLVRG